MPVGAPGWPRSIEALDASDLPGAAGSLTTVVRPSRQCAVLLVLVAATLLPSAAVGAGPPRYDWPVPAVPVRDFAAPPTPFAAGHRGVDLPVTPDQPVHPMAPGLVVHAGAVAGATWVTVQHDDGVRTSYGPLRPLTHAALGSRVDPDGAIGAAVGRAHGTAGLLHVGARRGDRYVDPAGLVVAPRRVATLVGPGRAGVDRTPGPPRPTLLEGAAPSPNRLIVLAGLTSQTGEVPFDMAALGYPAGTWQQYSYRGVDADGEPVAHGPQATWGRVHEMAVALRDQLRQHAIDHPGQAVDLVGHSLGGLVAMYELLVLHDATDPTLPPIGRVVTVASPLQGADSADAVARIRGNAFGRALLDLVATQLPTDDDGTPIVHPDVAVQQDLQTDADAVRALRRAWDRYREDPWSSPLATGTEVMTIGSVLDPVVNEHRSGLPGAAHETVFDPDPIGAHTGATRDSVAVEATSAFLAREPVPADGLVDHATGLVAGVGSRTLAGIEELIARGTGMVGDVVPLSPPW